MIYTYIPFLCCYSKFYMTETISTDFIFWKHPFRNVTFVFNTEAMWKGVLEIVLVYQSQRYLVCSN
jgi:hypothetical protein